MFPSIRLCSVAAMAAIAVFKTSISRIPIVAGRPVVRT
jgi:hypothetical protein